MKSLLKVSVVVAGLLLSSASLAGSERYPGLDYEKMSSRLLKEMSLETIRVTGKGIVLGAHTYDYKNLVEMCSIVNGSSTKLNPDFERRLYMVVIDPLVYEVYGREDVLVNLTCSF